MLGGWLAFKDRPHTKLIFLMLMIIEINPEKGLWFIVMSVFILIVIKPKGSIKCAMRVQVECASTVKNPHETSA